MTSTTHTYATAAINANEASTSTTSSIKADIYIQKYFILKEKKKKR